MGNSMPIRDLDMYAAPAPHSAAAVQGVVPVALGARVAANRGASGIDGVLSTGGWWAVSGEGTPAELAFLFLHVRVGLRHSAAVPVEPKRPHRV